VRLLWIGAGGAAGSILRYLLSGVAQNLAPRSTFPLGTLVVNLCGCFAIGLLAELVESHGFMAPAVRSLVMVGLIGGFTTFSAFANETVNAARDGASGIAALNVLLSVGLGLAAVWGGRIAVTQIWR
jgi:fluoride exporter